MGRVEVQGTPETLADSGALLEVEVTVPLPLRHYLEQNGYPALPVVRGMALLDTGAEASGVDEVVMMELGIPSLETIETLSSHGISISNVYNASVSLPQLGSTAFAMDQIVGCHLGEQILPDGKLIMLLGRDLLKNMAFSYDGRRGRFTVEV